DVVTREYAPHVPLAAVGPGRAGIGGGMGRGVNDSLVIAEKVAARSAPFPRRHQVRLGAGGGHYENLVAILRPGRGWKNQALAVRRPVGLGILAAMRELLDIDQVRRFRPSRGSQEEEESLHLRPSKRSRPATRARILPSATLRCNIQNPQSGWM